MGIHPLNIILVKSDSKSDRLLFRYPHMANHVRNSNRCTKRKKKKKPLFVHQYKRFIIGIFFISTIYNNKKKKRNVSLHLTLCTRSRFRAD